MNFNEDIYLHMLKLYEKKLKEIMSPGDFMEFVESVAKSSFEKSVDALPEGEFKNFVKNNLPAIYGEL